MIKCDYITCSLNSTNKEYKLNRRNCPKNGLCECKDDIVLSSEVICENCGEDVDALKCNNYLFKSSYPLNK